MYNLLYKEGACSLNFLKQRCISKEDGPRWLDHLLLLLSEASSIKNKILKCWGERKEEAAICSKHVEFSDRCETKKGSWIEVIQKTCVCVHVCLLKGARLLKTWRLRQLVVHMA